MGIDGKEIEVKAAGRRCDHLRRVHGDKKKKRTREDAANAHENI